MNTDWLSNCTSNTKTQKTKSLYYGICSFYTAPFYDERPLTHSIWKSTEASPLREKESFSKYMANVQHWKQAAKGSLKGPITQLQQDNQCEFVCGNAHSNRIYSSSPRTFGTEVLCCVPSTCKYPSYRQTYTTLAMCPDAHVGLSVQHES